MTSDAHNDINAHDDISVDNDARKIRRKDKSKDERKTERKDKFLNALWRAVKSVKNAIYPPDITCDICGAELAQDTRYNLCADCLSKIPTTPEHICLLCGTPLKDEADYCIRCENDKNEFFENRSPLIYDGLSKVAIHHLKFGGKKYLANTLGAMMSDEFIRRGMKAEIIVFVPMTVAEEKRRGFNQSELLAREVGKRLNLPVLPALAKIKETAAQKKLTSREREENLQDAFVCVFNQVEGRHILLIDDVFTTGATANACTRALLKAKARRVSVLTCAVTEKKIPFEQSDDKKSEQCGEKTDERGIDRKAERNNNKNIEQGNAES